MSLLLRRPLIMRGESLASYIARLGVANYCETPSLLTDLLLSDINPYTGIRETEVEPDSKRERGRDNVHLPKQAATFKRLKRYTGRDELELFGTTLHRYAHFLIAPEYKNYWLELGGQKLALLTSLRDTATIRSPKVAQYCPACLAENCYHRLRWSMEAVTVCLKHQCLLMDSCPSCGEDVSLSTVALGSCTTCTSDLRQSISDSNLPIGDNTEDFFLQKLIHYWLGEDEAETFESGASLQEKAQLPVQNPAMLYRVLTGLRQAVQEMQPQWPYYATVGKPLNSSVTQVVSSSKPRSLPSVESELHDYSATYSNHCEYLTAFKGLRNWPLGFYEFLDAYRQPQYRWRSYANKAYLDLGILYRRWLLGYWNRSGYMWLQHTFKQYDLKGKELSYRHVHAKAKNPYYRHSPYLTIEEAAHQLEMERWEVEALLEAGQLKSYASKEMEREQETFKAGVSSASNPTLPASACTISVQVGARPKTKAAIDIDIRTLQNGGGETSAKAGKGFQVHAYTLIARREVEELKGSGRADEIKQLLWMGNLLEIEDWSGYLKWSIVNARRGQGYTENEAEMTPEPSEA